MSKSAIAFCGCLLLLASPLVAQSVTGNLPTPPNQLGVDGGEPDGPGGSVPIGPLNAFPARQLGGTLPGALFKFDAGVTFSPYFHYDFWDDLPCCSPRDGWYGGWFTLGSGRFRLQVDYARGRAQESSYVRGFELLGESEAQIDRETRDEYDFQEIGASAYWRFSKSPRWTPHLLLGVGTWQSSVQSCVAQGVPSGGATRVALGDGASCSGGSSESDTGVFPLVGAGVDITIKGRFFGRMQFRAPLMEVRVGAGLRF